MSDRDTPEQPPVDELWDPDAQRRAHLALTMSERLEIVAALFRQAQILQQARVDDR